MDTPSTVEPRGPRTRSRANANAPALSSGLSRNVMNPDLIGNEDAARALQKLHEKVFRNDLLVKHICSFAESSDLSRLRLVNHLFLREATKEFRKLHPPIQLADELELEQFLKFEKARKEIPYTRFPFASFKLDMLGNIPTEVLEEFGKRIGQHVLRLSFRTCLCVKNIGDKVGILLAQTPNLTEIKLSSVKRVYISNDLLRQIPLTFPHLTNVNVNYRDFTSQRTYENATPLLEILISRAPRMQNFNIPVSSNSVVQAPDFGILKYLLMNRHPNAGPLLMSFFTDIRIYPNHLGFIRELELMSVKFLTLDIQLCHFIDGDLADDENPLEIYGNMMDKVHSWLATQTHLRSLTVSTRVNYVPFRLPSLSSLKQLSLLYSNDILRFLAFPHNPIVPFNPNQFPALQELRLDCYRNQYNIFGSHPPLTTVQHLQLNEHLSPFDLPRWRYLFPNLTSLQIELGPWVDWSSTVTFILRYFSHLVNLGLEMNRAQPQALDLWNILTGGAPRPVNNYTLMNGRVGGEIGNLAEPVDGIYDLPSLRNMKALKSLQFSGVGRSTLDAILYMTRAEFLVPLDVLNLKGIKFNARMKACDILPYQWRLARVHSEVNLC